MWLLLTLPSCSPPRFSLVVSGLFWCVHQSFLAWAGWHCEYDELDQEAKATVEELVQECNKRFGFTFQPGYNHDIKHPHFTLQPVDIAHVPLVVYALNAFAGALGGKLVTLVYKQQVHRVMKEGFKGRVSQRWREAKGRGEAEY